MVWQPTKRLDSRLLPLISASAFSIMRNCVEPPMMWIYDPGPRTLSVYMAQGPHQHLLSALQPGQPAPAEVLRSPDVVHMLHSANILVAPDWMQSSKRRWQRIVRQCRADMERNGERSGL